MKEIHLFVNGTNRKVSVDPSTPLLLVLRNELGLTGAKLGCGLEQCGACAVLVDGVSTLACAAPVSGFAGKAIVTVEGLADTGIRVQQAFAAAGAAQCGYCTPGLVIAVSGLLGQNPDPDETDIVAALYPHLCRCGSHPRVLRAIRGLVHRGTI